MVVYIQSAIYLALHVGSLLYKCNKLEFQSEVSAAFSGKGASDKKWNSQI